MAVFVWSREARKSTACKTCRRPKMLQVHPVKQKKHLRNSPHDFALRTRGCKYVRLRSACHSWKTNFLVGMACPEELILLKGSSVRKKALMKKDEEEKRGKKRRRILFVALCVSKTSVNWRIMKMNRKEIRDAWPWRWKKLVHVLLKLNRQEERKKNEQARGKTRQTNWVGLRITEEMDCTPVHLDNVHVAPQPAFVGHLMSKKGKIRVLVTWHGLHFTSSWFFSPSFSAEHDNSAVIAVTCQPAWSNTTFARIIKEGTLMAAVKGKVTPITRDPVVYQVWGGIGIPVGLSFVNGGTKYQATTSHVHNEEGSRYRRSGW